MRKPSECKGCPFYEIGKGFVPPVEGGDILIVGSSPMSEKGWWDGNHGRLLNKIFWHGGLKREDYSFVNLVQCHLDGFGLFSFDDCRAALSHCSVHRDKFIDRIKPKCVVTMGQEPATRMVGINSNLEEMRGYVYQDEWPIVPTLATNNLLKGDSKLALIPAILYDLKIGPKKAAKGPDKPEMLLYPTPLDFAFFCEEAGKAEWVVVDIETPMSKGRPEDELDDDNAPSLEILRASFAYFNGKEVTATSIPWQPPFTIEAKNLLSGDNDKILYNASFDIPRLVKNGYLVNGKIQDAMWLWHFFHPDLPRGLGFVATFFTEVEEWKSGSDENPVYYSAMDAYTTAKVYMGLMRELKSRGMWDVAQRHVTDLIPVLQSMTARGITVDREAVEKLKIVLGREKDEIQATLNEVVPEDCRKLSPPNGYVRTPANTSGLVEREFVLLPEVGKKCPVVTAKHKDPSCPSCKGTGKVVSEKEVVVRRWVKLEDFKPTSKDQLISYMEETGTEVPFSRKKGKATTEKKFLKRLIQKDKMIALMLRYRELSKVIGTYLNWPIKEDGKVHPLFLPVPATGRLSSSRPNFQNIPKESELGNVFRDCITASPGCLLIRYDFSGFEANLTGYFAEDRVFQKLATLGVYTYVMGKYLKVPLDIDDPELGKKLKALKAEHNKAKDGESSSLYKKFKTAVLGILYGLGAKKLFEENPGVFEEQLEATRLRNFVLNTFPLLKKWQERTVAQAQKQGFLMNPFGYIRWFWDIPGSDGPKAIAQLPQSTAAYIAKEAILRVNELEAGKYLVAMIHDELVFDVPLERVEAVEREVKEVMQRSIPELGGLSFKVEGEKGRTLRKEE